MQNTLNFQVKNLNSISFNKMGVDWAFSGQWRLPWQTQRVRQNIFWTALPLPKVHLCATYNKSSHLRILRGSSSWIWGETLIQYKILLKEMWKRTQCPVPKLFTSDCCRGENEFFSEECHTGVSVQGMPHAQNAVGQHK